MYCDWFVADQSEVPHWQSSDANSSTSIQVKADGEGDVQQSQVRKAWIQWKDLSYSVMVHKEGGGSEAKQLLNNVYGYCTPGMMVALMGASGAGKSTLLDVLANKKTHGTIAGDLLINGRPRDATFERVAAYVEQFDVSMITSTICPRTNLHLHLIHLISSV